MPQPAPPATMMYAGEPCRLAWNHYRDNNRPALELFTLEGEPMTRLTINIPELSLADDEFFLNHDVVSLGGYDAVLASGIAEPTGRVERAGYATFKVMRWLVELPPAPPPEQAPSP